MDYEWNENQKSLKKAVAAIVGKEARQDLDALEGAEPAAAKEMVLDWMAKLRETGYLTAEPFELLAAQETLAEASGSLYLSIETTSRLFAGLVLGHGSDELKGELEGPLQAGEIIGALPLIKTEAVPTAKSVDDGWIFDGVQAQLANAPIADWLMVSGNSEAGRVLGVVRPTDEGVTVEPRLGTLGYDGLPVAAVTLAGALVPKERVIGPITDYRAMAALQFLETQILTIASIGLMHRCTTAARMHARTHELGGKAMFKRQEIAFKLAEMLTMTQTAQLMTYRAAWLVATGDPEGPMVLRCAEVFAAESSQQVASRGLEICGGDGYVSGSVLERAWRESRFAPVAGVSSDQSRDAIATELLGKYQP